MANDFDKLAVLIEANTKSYENAMKKVMAQTDAAMKRVEGRTAQTERAMTKLSAGGDRVAAMFGRIGAAMVAGLSVQQAVRFAETFTQVQNGLRVAGLEGEQLNDVYGKLFASAQKNAAPLQSLTDLYSKLSLSQRELGINSDQLIGFTDRVALALRVGGTSAAQASGALLQMSQALGGGTVRAEEFNSMLEGTPTIVQAVARGLTEAGGSVAELRKLVNEGTVSSKAFFEAFLAGSADLEGKAAKQTLTTSQAFQTLNNALVDAVGSFDSATGATASFNDAVAATAGYIGAIGDAISRNAPAIRLWLDYVRELSGSGAAVSSSLSEQMRQLDATANVGRAQRDLDLLVAQRANIAELGGDLAELDAQIEQAQKRLAQTQTMALSAKMNVDRSRQEPSGTNAPPRTVSIADFKVGGNAPRSTAGRARAARPEREDPFKDFGFSDETINSAADYQDTLRALEEQTQRNREAFKSLGEQIVGGFRQGKGAAEIFSGVLDNMLSKLLDVGLNQIASALFPAPRLDPWAGMRMAGARALGGPVSANKPYLVGERGPELFVPSTAGSVASRMGGAANVNVQVINNNGSQVTTQGRGTAGDPLRIVVDAVKADIGRGGMDTAMGRFGVKPATRQR